MDQFLFIKIITCSPVVLHFYVIMSSQQASCMSLIVSDTSFFFLIRWNVYLYLVTIHPTDPQSRLGFTKCMQALYAMQIVWPSAGRAFELVGGAKDERSGDASDFFGPLANPSSVIRRKRSAEQLLDDSFCTQPSTDSRFDDMQPIRRTNNAQQQYSSGIGEFLGDNNYLGATPTTASSNMTPSNYAWQGGGMNTNGINTHLSTSVLPQLYSTGLGDENMHAPRMYSNVNNQYTNPSFRRYPSYYDFTNLPPLGSIHDIRDPTQVSQPQLQTSQMYIPENYSIYSMSFYLVFLPLLTPLQITNLLLDKVDLCCTWTFFFSVLIVDVSHSILTAYPYSRG